MTGSEVERYAVTGFLANGIHVGIKEGGRKDLALIFSRAPAKATGVFTGNCFKAAPVILDMERIKTGMAQAVLVNSGNANAATGQEGYKDALAMSGGISEKLGIRDELVLIASTGVIGNRLPMKRIEAGMGRLVEGLHANGIPDAEEAIMTTDKFPKIAFRKEMIGSKEVTLCGIAKGAGMIEPNMGTMLAFFMTDADIDHHTLNVIFRQAVNKSFNAITVDGCMSTNDTAIILANGVAGNNPIKRPSRNLTIFKEMLFSAMFHLAQSIVRDGEGATKLIEIVVEEAKSTGDAKKVACKIANSNLVKTAFFGGDPNWGRIVSAIGSAGIAVPVDTVRIYLEEIPVFACGQGIAGQEKRLLEIMGKTDISIIIKLGTGNKKFRVYTSDLSFDYVKINAHYRT
ncbi:MAG: bifunctional glutamate N-acetyltransferase/amino-acid acetyltransferase ArgJ [Syntrophales bacterium]|nr:bifunctional glutamate N-acetyltransferase/amino-acid acetyltransferase ArgJ [Syntrophales bacterium]